MVGVDPTSDGLGRAPEHGLRRHRRGRRLAARTGPRPEIVFEATSAKAHLANAPRYAEAGIQAVDLTPAPLGPYGLARR